MANCRSRLAARKVFGYCLTDDLGWLTAEQRRFCHHSTQQTSNFFTVSFEFSGLLGSKVLTIQCRLDPVLSFLLFTVSIR